jgi:leucyl aminopeptidase (aminopeptidase T)
VHREFPEYTVPYRLSVAGRIVSGESAYVRMKPGESTQLRIEVGEVENVVAGDYQDVLLLTVSPN